MSAMSFFPSFKCFKDMPTGEAEKLRAFPAEDRRLLKKKKIFHVDCHKLYRMRVNLGPCLGLLSF